MNSTQEDIITEYWACHYAEKGPDEEEFEDEDFDKDEVERLMEEHPDDWEEYLPGATGAAT